MLNKDLVNDMVQSEMQWHKDYIANEYYWFVCHKKPKLSWACRTVGGKDIMGISADMMVFSNPSSYAPMPETGVIEKYKTVDGRKIDVVLKELDNGFIPVIETPSDNDIYRYLIVPPDFVRCTLKVPDKTECSVTTGTVLVTKVDETGSPDLKTVSSYTLEDFYRAFADGLGL